MWNKLRARPPEPSRELAASLADLERLSARRPELKSPASALGRVLSAVFSLPPVLNAPYPAKSQDAEFLNTLWGMDEPVFLTLKPEFSEEDLRLRARRILKVLEPENPSAKPLSRAQIDWKAWAGSTLLGDPGGFEHHILSQDLDANLARSILRLTLLPVLSACTTALDALRPSAVRGSENCPCCGQPPLFAESRGLEGNRFLRCGLCAAEWPAPRLGCMRCGETSTRALNTLSVEGDEAGARLVRCETCGFGLKVLPTFARLSAPGLLVSELATVHLDFL